MIVDKIIQGINQVAPLYHRLVILAGPANSGKTVALRDVHDKIRTPLFNVNLYLSRHMLELTERQRALQLPRLLSDLVNTTQAEVVLLDNIEILFHPSLAQDPLRLLKGLSRNQTLVAAWNGLISNGHLIYATPDHPEFRRYSVKDLILIESARE